MNNINTVAKFKTALFDALDIGFIKPVEVSPAAFERSVSEYVAHCQDCECITSRGIPAQRTSSEWFADYVAMQAAEQLQPATGGVQQRQP